MKSTIHKDDVIKVKFEVDCNSSLGLNVETKWIDVPEYAPSLFSGKLHAILSELIEIL